MISSSGLCILPGIFGLIKRQEKSGNIFITQRISNSVITAFYTSFVVYPLNAGDSPSNRCHGSPTLRRSPHQGNILLLLE